MSVLSKVKKESKAVPLQLCWRQGGEKY